MKRRTLKRDTNSDTRVIWSLIGAFLVAVGIMTGMGLIDWTPKQANVPQSTTPLTESQVHEAVNNGSLEIQPY